MLEIDIRLMTMEHLRNAFNLTRRFAHKAKTTRCWDREKKKERASHWDAWSHSLLTEIQRRDRGEWTPSQLVEHDGREEWNSGELLEECGVGGLDCYGSLQP